MPPPIPAPWSAGAHAEWLRRRVITGRSVVLLMVHLFGHTLSHEQSMDVARVMVRSVVPTASVGQELEAKLTFAQFRQAWGRRSQRVASSLTLPSQAVRQEDVHALMTVDLEVRQCWPVGGAPWRCSPCPHHTRPRCGPSPLGEARCRGRRLLPSPNDIAQNPGALTRAEPTRTGRSLLPGVVGRSAAAWSSCALRALLGSEWDPSKLPLMEGRRPVEPERCRL